MQRTGELLATLSLLGIKGGGVGTIDGMTRKKSGMFGSIILVFVEITNDELMVRRR